MSLCHKSEPLNLASIPHGDFNSISEHHATKGYWKPSDKKIKQNQSKERQEKQLRNVATSLTTFERIACRELKE